MDMWYAADVPRGRGLRTPSLTFFRSRTCGPNTFSKARKLIAVTSASEINHLRGIPPVHPDSILPPSLGPEASRKPSSGMFSFDVLLMFPEASLATMKFAPLMRWVR